jgi:hypothetical protein
MTTREMLDKVASQNFQKTVENAQLKQQLAELSEALLDCFQNLPAQSRKALQSQTLKVLDRLSPAEAKARAKAAAN